AAAIAGLDGMIAVRTGAAHTCAIDALTHAVCWGANDVGQLGDGTTVDRLTPSASHSSVLALGGDRTCGRITWGEVACWGEGYGSAPVMVENLGEASFVAVGAAHACAAHLVGVPRCWGENDRGQLGDGTTTAAVVPVDALPPPR
ncbi:MAG: RCC1 repeat-containing protein, partial [Myxococcota bacterium]|nr:RCC1 repeat-containing protein [Myxococcota bacterium]